MQTDYRDCTRADCGKTTYEPVFARDSADTADLAARAIPAVGKNSSDSDRSVDALPDVWRICQNPGLGFIRSRRS